MRARRRVAGNRGEARQHPPVGVEQLQAPVGHPVAGGRLERFEERLLLLASRRPGRPSSSWRPRSGAGLRPPDRRCRRSRLQPVDPAMLFFAASKVRCAGWPCGGARAGASPIATSFHSTPVRPAPPVGRRLRTAGPPAAALLDEDLEARRRAPGDDRVGRLRRKERLAVRQDLRAHDVAAVRDDVGGLVGQLERIGTCLPPVGTVVSATRLGAPSGCDTSSSRTWTTASGGRAIALAIGHRAR